MKYRLIATVRVKNEGWILESWLKRTCEYADAIIALNDGSKDDSAKLLKSCPKVIEVLDKPGDIWDELPDRNLLLTAARHYDPEWIHIIDPDEIMDARLSYFIDDILADRMAGQHFFREVTLWRSINQYRIDLPEKYHRRDGTNQIVRINPSLRWERTREESWKRRGLNSVMKLRAIPARRVGNLSLVGIRGEARYHELVRLHYHFANWNRSWYVHMRYAVIEAIQMRRKLDEVEHVISWATDRMKEEGLVTRSVDDAWGVLPISDYPAGSTT